jgi:isoleucyl-tRNA synthetase
VNDFCIVDLSAFYFDVLKDRLYISAPKSHGRRSAQTAIWHIGEALVRLLAPILSFSCEEIWQYLPKVEGRSDSVHLALFPGSSDILGSEAPEHDAQQDKDWAVLRTFRDAILKRLEELRNNKTIGGGLEAQVNVSASGDFYATMKRYEDQLRYLLIVSAVHLERMGDGSGTLATISVGKADGAKCERCWNYSIHVGEDKNYPTVCERCSAVLREIGAEIVEA